jgi:hypothetical protein
MARKAAARYHRRFMDGKVMPAEDHDQDRALFARIRDAVEASGYVTRPMKTPGDASCLALRASLRQPSLREMAWTLFSGGLRPDVAVVLMRARDDVSVDAIASRHLKHATIIADHLSQRLQRPVPIGRWQQSFDPL